MKLIRLAAAILAAAAIFCSVSAQAYQARSLLLKKIWVLNNGKADKPFPGEGDIKLLADMNFNMLSSMYIEGQGYCERGKVSDKGEYAINKDGALTVLELDSIDYVYGWGGKVHLKNGSDADLILKVQDNQLKPLGLMAGIWAFNKEFGELKKKIDIEGVAGFAFSKDAAQRALAAQKALEAKLNEQPAQ